MRQLDLVEADLAEQPSPTRPRSCATPAGLDRLLGGSKSPSCTASRAAFTSARPPPAVERAVTALAGRGVAYITLPHLLWRGVATNAPALPFLPDSRLPAAVPPAQGQGLSELGRAAVTAMARERVLVDLVAHEPSARCEDTFGLLDELDPGQTVPVVASHAGSASGARLHARRAERASGSPSATA